MTPIEEYVLSVVDEYAACGAVSQALEWLWVDMVYREERGWY